MQFKQHSVDINDFVDEKNTLSFLAKRVLLARDIKHCDELSFSLKALLPIGSLGSIEDAVALLVDAIENKRRVLVIGDYDVDGATATALMVRAMHLMGHDKIDYLVPDRFEYGYGLTPEIVALAETYSPWLLMTVDNGVSSIEGVLAAKQQGYKVLITDHHLPGKELPEADVMVNPNLKGDPFLSPYLSGVGVVFYLVLALKRALLKRNYQAWKTEPNLLELLDLVALGTIADLVPLDKNNRILVEQGLRQLRQGKGQLGIKALLKVSGKKANDVLSSDFAFACGPRLNAAGRLSDMSIGIQCLLSQSVNEAHLLAMQLDRLNQERKAIESEMKRDAQTIIEALPVSFEEGLPSIICLHDDGWHEGVIGILASRLKERYYRPCIIFANGKGGLVKGSGRSILGVHMRDLIESVAHQNKSLIKRFGGHAMAAGLTLKKDDLPFFIEQITQTMLQKVEHDTFQEVIYTDGALSATEITLDNALLLRRLMPWGQQFFEPLFEGVFLISQLNILKGLHIKVELKPLMGNQRVEGIMFFADIKQWPTVGSKVNIVYKLSVNDFKNQQTVQLIITHLRA